MVPANKMVVCWGKIFPPRCYNPSFAEFRVIQRKTMKCEAVVFSLRTFTFMYTAFSSATLFIHFFDVDYSSYFGTVACRGKTKTLWSLMTSNSLCVTKNDKAIEKKNKMVKYQKIPGKAPMIIRGNCL